MNSIKLGANLVREDTVAQLGDIFMINSDIGCSPYMLVSDGNGEGIVTGKQIGRAHV